MLITHEMKKIALPLVIFAVGGCAFWPWEPFPDWKVENIGVQQVPHRVRSAMHAEHPDVSIQKIERSTLMSRIEGYPKQYRFTFTSGSGTVETSVFDERGERVESDIWFGEQE